jgi:hypothetical protein
VNLDRLFNIAGSIVVVALVTVIVTSKNSARIVSATGGAFSNSLKTAMGRR